MDHLLRQGRILFAVGIAFFGLQYLYFGRFLGGLPPVPPWTPGAPLAAYLTGAALVVAAVCKLVR